MRTFVLIGNPNSGKSTLFNELTGSCQKIGNWAGVTTEQKKGFLTVDDETIELVDLPGLYTLHSATSETSLDEQIPYQFLFQQPYERILNVVDATHLERHLYLTLQLLELGKPLVVVLTMMDNLKKQGKIIDIAQLSERLGCPVIAAERHSKTLDFKKAILTSITSPQNRSLYPVKIEASLTALTEAVKQAGCAYVPRVSLLGMAFHYLGLDWQKIPALPGVLQTALTHTEQCLHQETGYTVDVALAHYRFLAIEHRLKGIIQQGVEEAGSPSWTPWIDALLLNRFLGFPLFLTIMYGLFMFAIQVGGALEGWVETLTHGALGGIREYLVANAIAPLSIALMVDGFGEGISTLLAFIPVLGAMFLALSVLEDCGYMARAAFVVDKLMQKLGLPGKSFVPMIIGFGCNVPAIMAARTLERERDRILTIMMSPFMSCSARLAIYTLFVAAFFPKNGQNIVFLLYLIGIVVSITTGWLLRKTILTGEASPLIMELPNYQLPTWNTVGRHTLHKLNRFLKNAARWIIPVCMVISVLNTVKFSSDETLLAHVGKSMTPILKPMGIEEHNWPAAVGLLSGVVAKEVVVGTLNTLYTQEMASTGSNQTPMGVMSSHFAGQSGAFAYLLFVLLYFPCVSATSAIAKEINGRWSFFASVWATGLAYALSVMFYQATHLTEQGWWAVVWIVSMMMSLGLGFYVICQLVQKQPKLIPTKITLSP
jgi:ferrous iron transport protein B